MRVLALALGCSFLAAACSHDSTPSTPSPQSPTVTSVAVEGAAPIVGATTQLQARATLSDGTTQLVTSQATWRSSNASVLTVSASGVATGVGPGDADVTAQYSNATGSSRLSVRTPLTPTVSVSGTLVDDRVGSALRDGSVTVVDGPDAGKSAAADASGNYTLANLTRGALRLRASANGYDASEQTLAVNGDMHVDFPLHQIPVPCAYAVTQPSGPVPVDGQQLSFAISRTIGGCSWQASSSASWITLAGANSGSNSAPLAVRVDPNTSGNQRSGSITVQWSGGSASIAIVQAGTSCAFDVSVLQVGISSGGLVYPSASVVTTGPTCAWTASTTASWLFLRLASNHSFDPSAFTHAVSATGPDTIDILSNATVGCSRTAEIKVLWTGGTATITATQAPQYPPCQS